MGNITDQERFKRFSIIKELDGKGLSDYQISQETGLSINVVKNSKAYLETLNKVNISPEEVAEKRSELYLELSEASSEAKTLFNEFKSPIDCPACNAEDTDESKICKSCRGFGKIYRSKEISRFFKDWVDSIEKRAKLFGLDNVKAPELTFQQNILGDQNTSNYISDMKLDGEAREVSEKLSLLLKEQHEKRVSSD